MSDDLSPAAQEKLLKLQLRLAQIEKNERSQNNFLDFVKTVWPDFISGRHHRIIAEKLERVARGDLKRLIINMPPRHRLALDTPVLTTNGWKTIETVQPGDRVYGSDGRPQLVTGKSDVYEEPLYEVTTDEGETFVTDAEHRWKAWAAVREQVNKSRETRPVETVVSTKDIADCKLRPNRATRLVSRGPLHFPPADLPVDPYVLGVWLGDGSKRNAVVTSDDPDSVIIRSEIEARGYRTTDQKTPKTFGILELKKKLRGLGVLGNKHIPEDYLFGSVEQRYALLRGLMDTDGNVTKKGQCFFTQSDARIIESVRRLLWSLGIKNTLHSWVPSLGGVEHKRAYKISFYAEGVSTLPRKRDRCREPRAFGSRLYAKARPLGRKGLVQCIQVANADQVFMVGRSFTPTMNTKSEFASYLFPAWFMGRAPGKQIIQATHTTELAVGFGRKTKNLIESDAYRTIFPDVRLATDSKASGRWNTNKGGSYYAVGVGSNLAGRGGDLVIIDDPHSEQTAMSTSGFDDAWDWYTGGPRQRLQPGGSIILVQTRWSEKDMTGQLLRAMAKDPMADQWEVVELPAIFEDGTPCWPEFWSLDDLNAVKASIPPSKWNAQYQQNPTGDDNAIIPREWWRRWTADRVPQLQYVIQSYDTAFSKRETSDFSAITTWGVFYPNEGGSGPNLILLDSKKGRWDFPELKHIAFESYQFWEPDTVIVEAKASGMPLTHELRQTGIPVVNFTPSRGNDKLTRVHSVAPLFEAGMVWAPDEVFADEMIEEVAAFPNGEYDDLVDSMTQALMRYRQGNFVQLPTDDWEDEDKSVRLRSYY